MPPLTSRGEPMVVGNVPTKYCWSNMFCTPKNTSKFRLTAREALKSATAYFGRPGAVWPGTMRMFRSSSNWVPRNWTENATVAYLEFAHDACTDPRCFGTCGRNLPTSTGFVEYSFTFAWL